MSKQDQEEIIEQEVMGPPADYRHIEVPVEQPINCMLVDEDGQIRQSIIAYRRAAQRTADSMGLKMVESSVHIDPTKHYLDGKKLCVKPPRPDKLHRFCYKSKQWKRLDLPYTTERRLEYPALEEFADAFYWERRGDPSKMEAYLSKIDAVKGNHPKPTPDPKEPKK